MTAGQDSLSPEEPVEEPRPAPDEEMSAARPRVGTGTAPVFGLLMALLLIGLGVVGIQEGLVRSGAIGAGSWTSAALGAGDGIEAVNWMVPVFVVLVVLGLLVLPVVVMRRPRKTVTLAARTGVYLRTADLARITDSLVHGADGVIDVHSSATQRQIHVRATTTSAGTTKQVVGGDIEARLAPSLAALEHPPRIKVDLRNEELT